MLERKIVSRHCNYIYVAFMAQLKHKRPDPLDYAKC